MKLALFEFASTSPGRGAHLWQEQDFSSKEHWTTARLRRNPSHSSFENDTCYR
jgi:hypothetical protein